ncbi:MAG: hypothetical protein DCC55_11305, partial [Chloroflexi bacterium]
MAEQVTKLYAKLKPLIIADVAKMGRGGGGATVSVGVLTPHALDNLTIHTGQLARSQALWVAEDIAAHAALPDVHHPRASGAAGVSVDASSQQVSLNRAPTSGLTITSDQVAIGTPTTSSSTSANAVTADSHSHAVIAHTDGLANPSQLAKFHSDGGMSFGRVTTPLITTASGNLTLTPAGRVDLTAGKEIRTTDSVTGLFGAGWRMTNVAGHGFLDIREIQVEELRAYLFMADFVRVQIGEDFITESMGVLYADVTIPAVDATTTLIVEDVPFFSGALFADNDWVMMALIDRSGGGLTIARAWGQVSNYVDLGADANGVRRQQWTYTHRDGENDVGLVFKKGSIVMGWGQPGQGYIHHSVVDSGGSPYTRYATWSGANPYTPANRTIHTQIGNLESITDTTLEPTGYGLYGTNVFLKGDVIAANGLVALNSDGASIVTSTDWFASNRLSFLWQTLDGTEHAYVGSRSSDSIGYQLSLAAKGITSGGWGTIALRARTSAQSIESPNDSEGGTMLITPANVFIGPNRGVRIASTDDELATNVPGGELYAEVIHVFTLNATTIVGDTMSGQEWEFAGSMKIDANSASDTTVTIINEGAGRSDLNVDRNIIVGGTVDGVAVNALKGQFDSHIADANAHHAQVHPLTSANHTVSGLTAGQALLATSATTFAFGSYSHTNLTNVTADQHHNQVHVLATNSGLGADHTISGAATGHVLRATSATAAAFAQLQHSDLGGVTANQHHNQVHNIIGSDHTVAGSQFQLVGLTATNTPGLLTPSSNPGSAAAILRTGAAGDLTLKTLTVQGNVDITSGGDLTVGANVVFVDVSGQNVGINRAPDSQFDLDVAGALRATYLIGKHAIQLSGARMILHFDGQEPSNTNF